MRVAFAGTPEFAAVALRALLDAGHQIVLVLSQPDRPAGRGLKLQASPVKRLALSRAIAVEQPRSLRLDGRFPDDAAAARVALEAAAPEVMVVAAYGLILPAWVLTLPTRGCLNIHASLLPRWRGAAPIQRAIEAGDAETGITIMQMDEGLDTGATLLVERTPIADDDTAGTLQDRLAVLGGQAIVRALAAPALRPQPQPAEGITYAHKITKAEAAIDWSQSADAIARRVRAFDPQPGAYFDLGGTMVKLWRARVHRGGAPGAPGQVQAADGELLRVGCGVHALDLIELQRPGGRRSDARGFLQATRLGAGDRLG